MDLHAARRSTDDRILETVDVSPSFQALLRSQLDLDHALEIDASLGWADAMPAVGVSSAWRSDVRLGWRPNPHLELSFALRDLLASGDVEFVSVEGSSGTTFGRCAHAALTWRF
jgi:hypothetical protein